MEPARLDETDLLAAAVAGEPEAVAWLLDDVGPVVYGYVYARVGGDAPVAEDLLQETFLEAVRSAAGFRGDAAVSTWMCTIARRRIARHWERERKRDVARSRLQLVRDEPVPSADSGIDRDEVIEVLGSLRPVHRQVLVLKYLDGASVEEIAAEIGRTRVQVQSLLQRAREALRRALEGRA